MNSEDSDDEPLSTLATAKKPIHIKRELSDSEDEFRKKHKKQRKSKKKKNKRKKLTITIKIPPKDSEADFVVNPPEIQMPMDVWLYMKDLNPTGPYSCLLCSEWFINKSKLIIHYVLNHKKDYCGVCRYFVPDREAWLTHTQFHLPLCCSQCTETFVSDKDLRKHFSDIHDSVHCRLCYFMMPDNEQYHNHLYQKHKITNIDNKDSSVFWDFEYEGSPKFSCMLCSKKDTLSSEFFRHYMCFHKFTLKCFTAVLSGKDVPFTVFGANISSTFLENELGLHNRVGYVDSEERLTEIDPKALMETSDSNVNLLHALIPEIKQEVHDEENTAKQEGTELDLKPSKRKLKLEKGSLDNLDYTGTQDYDTTLTELIIFNKGYVNYVDLIQNISTSKSFPIESSIKYENQTLSGEFQCEMCSSNFSDIDSFAHHMYKMHLVRIEPTYFCRICITNFDTESDLLSHEAEEMAEFEDLWICQFCDQEFENREKTREHLLKHIDEMNSGNCFSPHLGFKCRYCATLFWTETDRESHHLKVHFSKHKSDFYKCTECSLTFSDKVWFTHHYSFKHSSEDSKYLYKCNICCIVLKTIQSMREHFNAEHPEAKKTFCSLGACQYKPFCRNKNFKIHLKVVHGPQTTAALQCPICTREFNNARACGSHMAQAHGAPRFHCKLCRHALHTSDERTLHYLLRHPGRHPYECTICGKSFEYRSSLYIHRAEHAAAANNTVYTCDYCSKEFNRKDSWREHLLIHEGPRHACSYCPMVFVQRSNMLRHERRHTGERPYTCMECGRAFADKGALNSHLRTHAPAEAHPCPYCGQQFAHKSKLKYHVRKHTGENLESCTICAKLFTSMCSLRAHMVTHQDKKKVKCPVCARVYQKESYMIRHYRTTHSDETPVSCPICPRRLHQSGALRPHILTHSKVHVFKCSLCSKSSNCKKTIVRHLRDKHNIQSDEPTTMKQYFITRDVRDCKLGLSEELLNKIFGPKKKYCSDVVISDFVTFPTNFPEIKAGHSKEEDGQTEEDGPIEEEVERDSEQQSAAENDEKPVSEEILKRKVDNLECKRGSRKKKKKKKDSEDESIETTFVDVKIEPLDE